MDVRDKLLWVNRGTGAPTPGQTNPYFPNEADAETDPADDFFYDGDDRLRESEAGRGQTK